jgi:hypothetical protein
VTGFVVSIGLSLEEFAVDVRAIMEVNLSIYSNYLINK